MPARALDLSARDLMACQNDTPEARLGSVQRRAEEGLCPMGPQGGEEHPKPNSVPVRSLKNFSPYPRGVWKTFLHTRAEFGFGQDNTGTASVRRKRTPRATKKWSLPLASCLFPPPLLSKSSPALALFSRARPPGSCRRRAESGLKEQVWPLRRNDSSSRQRFWSNSRRSGSRAHTATSAAAFLAPLPPLRLNSSSRRCASPTAPAASASGATPAGPLRKAQTATPAAAFLEQLPPLRY